MNYNRESTSIINIHKPYSGWNYQLSHCKWVPFTYTYHYLYHLIFHRYVSPHGVVIREVTWRTVWRWRFGSSFGELPIPSKTGRRSPPIGYRAVPWRVLGKTLGENAGIILKISEHLRISMNIVAYLCISMHIYMHIYAHIYLGISSMKYRWTNPKIPEQRSLCGDSQ